MSGAARRQIPFDLVEHITGNHSDPWTNPSPLGKRNSPCSERRTQSALVHMKKLGKKVGAIGEHMNGNEPRASRQGQWQSRRVRERKIRIAETPGDPQPG